MEGSSQDTGLPFRELTTPQLANAASPSHPGANDSSTHSEAPKSTMATAGSVVVGPRKFRWNHVQQSMLKDDEEDPPVIFSPAELRLIEAEERSMSRRPTLKPNNDDSVLAVDSRKRQREALEHEEELERQERSQAHTLSLYTEMRRREVVESMILDVKALFNGRARALLAEMVTNHVEDKRGLKVSMVKQWVYPNFTLMSSSMRIGTLCVAVSQWAAEVIKVHQIITGESQFAEYDLSLAFTSDDDPIDFLHRLHAILEWCCLRTMDMFSSDPRRVSARRRR